MAIQLFPQIQLHPAPIGSGGVGGGGGSTAAHTRQLDQENNQRQRELAALGQSITASPATQNINAGDDNAPSSGMSVNTGATEYKLDPEAYVQNLAKVNPKAAQEYSQQMVNLQRTQLQLKSEQQNFQNAQMETSLRSFQAGVNWLNATGDGEGAKHLINTGFAAVGHPPILDIKRDAKGNVSYLDGSTNKWQSVDAEHLAFMNAKADTQLTQLEDNKRWSQRLAYLEGKGLEGRLAEWDKMHADGDINDEDWSKGRQAIIGGARRIGPPANGGSDKSNKAAVPTKTDYTAAQTLIDAHDVLGALSSEERKNAATLAASTFRSIMNANPKKDESEAWQEAISKEASQVQDTPSTLFGKQMPWSHKVYNRTLPPNQQVQSSQQQAPTLPQDATLAGKDKRTGKQVYKAGDKYYYEDGTEAK